MPKRTDLKSILIIGAGPIIIGQACEFDYSGAQACKALKEEGYRVILVNSNPATIMTDPELADATYIEPITVDIVTKIIEKEKPDALLPTMGGQTALNTALSLFSNGILKKHNVEMIGANAAAIDKAEDRELFKKAMDKIGLESPKSILAHNLSDALAALDEIGLPIIIRPSFTLGGTGGGTAYNREEFITIVESGIDASPTNEVLIEESVIGWKEYEMEVVRDKADNCIIVCSIENIDPMGVHTGDSITIAPSLTLTDKEYQIMRNASIAVLREIGIETGGSNVQFAVDPNTGRQLVIEMNPRVSRSSALASKATGFPIARVATKLAIGYTLDELSNEITGGVIPASFEPSIDYIVTKIPRFAFEKFPGAKDELLTSMQSVGEAMAIGRNFSESIQKALCSLEVGLSGFDEIEFKGLGEGDDKNIIRSEIAKPTSNRILKIAQAFRHSFSVDDVHKYSKVDPWFLSRIKELVDIEMDIKENGLSNDPIKLRQIKSLGFSDERLEKLLKKENGSLRKLRANLNIHPVYKRIDTCAGEFNSPTAYMYSSYDSGLFDEPVCEAAPSKRDKVIILGGGPNRIGQGIEFDYCCCHAAFALNDYGIESIMVNCNPETVSTDFDTSDRLYFEPLTDEQLLEIIRVEQKSGNLLGVIVQFGGQTPLKLAKTLENENLPILGTSQDTIDLSEDRDRFNQFLIEHNLTQPPNGIAKSAKEAISIAEEIGYPIVIRPSYVLGGRAMEIVHEREQLERYIENAVLVSGDTPVLIDSFLHEAIEIDVDALCDGENTYICGILEHIEEAGIHSGDSACSLPPHSISQKYLDMIIKDTKIMAKGLGVIGLMNIQFALKDDKLYVIEVNPRASRTVPFVSKATNIPAAKKAVALMLGKDFDKVLDRKYQNNNFARYKHFAVKEAVFPFDRFAGVDILLGPEMRSTGEVMGIDNDFTTAFLKSQLGASVKLRKSGTIFISVKESDKQKILRLVQDLKGLNLKIIATGGTQRYLKENNIDCERINKVLEGRPHVIDAMQNNEIDMVINTTEGTKSIEDSKSLRRTTLLYKIPYYTTIEGATQAIEAMKVLIKDVISVKPIQEYIKS